MPFEVLTITIPRPCLTLGILVADVYSRLPGLLNRSISVIRELVPSECKLSVRVLPMLASTTFTPSIYLDDCMSLATAYLAFE